MQVNLLPKASDRRRATTWRGVCATGCCQSPGRLARRFRWRKYRRDRRSCRRLSLRSTDQMAPGGWNGGAGQGDLRADARRGGYRLVRRGRPYPKVTLFVDGEKAAAAGLSSTVVASVVRMAGSGEVAGLLHDRSARRHPAGDSPAARRPQPRGDSVAAADRNEARRRWRLTRAEPRRKNRACITRTCMP